MKTTCGNHALARSVVSGDARVIEKVHHFSSGVLGAFLIYKIASEGGCNHPRESKFDGMLLNVTGIY